jgi:ABC-type branched-subunit amino acid transport system substrate-binding protein
VKIIDRKRIWPVVLIVIPILLAGAWIGYTVIHTNTPVRIGVLLDLNGDVDFTTPLEWAKDTINSEGGINGRQVELVYWDSSTGDIHRQAQELLDDDTIQIVIGPEKSDDVFALAPQFIAKKKVLISPTATSGEILRAFGKNWYVWRTTQGDAAQVKVILTILKGKGAKNVALLAVNNTYGQTFYDWTGFFATEYGIDVTSLRQFDAGSPNLEAEVADALEADPDYIIAACWPEDAATIKRVIDRSGSRTKLFLTDAGTKHSLIQLLGTSAEGIEGTNPSADPDSGFTAAYEETFGHRPDDYAATTYDALLIAAFTEARQERVFFEPPGESVRQVVIGEATVTGWNASGVRTALHDIHSGEMPWITGASGGLEYDEDLGVDPIASWYSHWQVNNGTFRTLAFFNSANLTTPDKSGGESAGNTGASAGYMSAFPESPGSGGIPENKTDFKAVIVAPSVGWKDYRHESDALAIYTVLKERQVSDDNIILMLYDDIPFLPENPLQGDVHNIPKGVNLRPEANADYTGRSVTAGTLKNVLLGNMTSATPFVLVANETTDVFVYIASHGSHNGLSFPADEKTPFTSEDFREITDTMSREQKYRQIVFMVDTCFGESIAVNVSANGLLYFTGSNKNEPSLSATYDMDIRQWLSNEFTSGVLTTLKEDKNITFRDLYPATYARVKGSHVRMMNAENFKDIDVPVLEFLKP